MTHYKLRRSHVFYSVAGDKKWIKAGLRHTYASAMINSGKSIDATCLALGHKGSPQVLCDQYHYATSEEQAKAYWRIFPPAA
jgi:hypothetical protein